MRASRLEYLYMETHDWAASRAFWEGLGWSLVLDLGTAGRFEPPGGGVGVFIEQVDGRAFLSVKAWREQSPNVQSVLDYWHSARPSHRFGVCWTAELGSPCADITRCRR